MNFPVAPDVRLTRLEPEWYETGDEPQGYERKLGMLNLSLPNRPSLAEKPYIAANGAEYFERRWAFKNGVDMILRFESSYKGYCTSTLLVPAENAWPLALRGFIYLLFLFYIFLGIAIISDVFMSGIEKITASREREVQDGVDEAGNPRFRTEIYEVWNGTVANLTLMALGSSAPEILLSLVETITNLDKPPGELGPSTIVGSASFNLLVITAVCMMGLEESKKVEQLGVFIITSVASIWAYVWLLIALNYVTPDVIEVWEAILTFLFFPILVGLAYGQDVNWCRKPAEDDNMDDGPTRPDSASVAGKTVGGDDTGASVDAAVAHEIRKARIAGEHANATEIGRLVARGVRRGSRQKLNRGHYRINAIRSLMAKQHVIHEAQSPPTPKAASAAEQEQMAHQPGVVEFDSPNYAVLESEGPVVLRVVRRKGFAGRLEVKYSTQDLTATDKVHYHSQSGTLVFEDGDLGPKTIPIPIIDNEEQNDDMTFMCRLEAHGQTQKMLGDCRLSIVRIIDDDNPGEVEFESEQIECAESDGKVIVHVLRHRGVTGKLEVKYETEDGVGDDAARCGGDQPDYQACSGTLVFGQGEHTKMIEIPIFDDYDYEKSEHFFVRLTGIEGKGCLGKIRKVRINISENPETSALYDDARKRAQEEADVSKKIETSSWLEQFRGAMTIDCEEGEEPEAFAMVMHFLTFSWKVIFAFVPPTDYCGGWLCFTVSLMVIGMIVYITAETAMLFGCAVGLADPVTAITFVALGTSLPDTFASKSAAQQEDTVDAAIGNVTGSNSVNVFLGLGLPWLVAAVYYEAQGVCYIIPAGSLAFSVLVFTVCAIAALIIIFGLRILRGAELGGPPALRYGVGGFLCFLWFLYILLSSLHTRTNITTGVIEGHFTFPGTDARCPCDCPKEQLRKLMPVICQDKLQDGNCGT